MKISVEFLGFPMVSNVLGKRLELDIPGSSVKDLIDELVRRHGRKIENAFYDEKGTLDVTLQMMINGKLIGSADIHSSSLNEGDTLTFMLLLAGG